MRWSSRGRAAAGLLCALIVLVPRPSDACRPPPMHEYLMNAGSTLDPDGGLIFIDEQAVGPEVRFEIKADGAPAPDTRVEIVRGLSVLHFKAGTQKVEVLRDGKVTHTSSITSSPVVAPPKLAFVRSSARRSTKRIRSGSYPPLGEITIQIAGEPPPEAFTLVIYQVTGADAIGIAHGNPIAKRVSYSVGGKNCGPRFSALYPGDRVAVAWLDLHGRLSKRSAVITVGS